MLWLTVGLTNDSYPLNAAISLCFFENPYKSWKRTFKEETLSITWGLFWMFCFDSFFFDVFPNNLGDYLVVLWTFCLQYFLRKKRKIFQWIIWLYLFIEIILMIWIFFILIWNIYWNKFWCYTDIWVGFKESKDNFSCFIW